MSIESNIVAKLQHFSPVYLDVINESNQHNVPPGSESHFKVTLVSPQFEGKMLVARHRMVNAVLADEISGAIHALALHTMTPDEWFGKSGVTADSPLCLGGDQAKNDK